jgi:hypothetical protein
MSKFAHNSFMLLKTKKEKKRRRGESGEAIPVCRLLDGQVGSSGPLNGQLGPRGSAQKFQTFHYLGRDSFSTLEAKKETL